MAEPTRWLAVDEGDIPFIASFPHTGTTVPAEYLAGFESLELARRDTDWHLEKLFAPILPKGTTVVRTDISRSVIDVNRPPNGQSLYPGQATTDLCPQTDFDGVPLYRDGVRLSPEEIERRRTQYHAPFAEMLAQQISRLRGMYDCVVVLDCHSIRPRVPRLFKGTLPALNIGTNDGASCSLAMQQRFEKVVARSPFSWVSNGRFKGGWITRHLGDPGNGVEAIQIEIAMNAYLDVAKDEEFGAPSYDANHAGLLQWTLKAVIAELTKDSVS